MGNPNGVAWTDETWARATPDFDKITELAPTTVGHALCQACPNDATRTTVRTGRPKRPVERGGPWSPGSCTYCEHRPLAPANTKQSALWWYGTGNGAHNPYGCKAFLRFLAEGGDRRGQPEFVSHLQSCVRIPPPRATGE